MDNLADLKKGIDQMRSVASLLTRWAEDMEKSLAENAPDAEPETVYAEDAAPAVVPAASVAVPVVSADAAPAVSAAPVTPAFTLPEVRTILTEKCAAGFSAQVKALIESYGVSSLREVPAEKYGELVDMVRGLGEAGEADAG